MPSKKSADLSPSLVAIKGQASPSADATGRQSGSSPALAVGSAPLNFKVPAEFRRRFRQRAAEADLKLRGPGDLSGTQQSGLPFELKIANIAKDGRILQYAREIAEKVLENDPLLERQENYILTKQLTKLARQKINWSMIS